MRGEYIRIGMLFILTLRGNATLVITLFSWKKMRFDLYHFSLQGLPRTAFSPELAPYLSLDEMCVLLVFLLAVPSVQPHEALCLQNIYIWTHRLPSMQIKYGVYSGHANWVSYLLKLNMKAISASVDLSSLPTLSSSIQNYEVLAKYFAHL